MDAIAKLYELGDVEIRELEDCDIVKEAPGFVRELIPDVPAWIEQDITCDQVAAILQGGCASGAYMPAVTYHQASATMAEHGDDVLEFLEDSGLLEVSDVFTLEGESWSGFACKVLSAAVEAWAGEVAGAIEDADTSEAIDYDPPLSWDEAIKARDADHD